MNRLIQSMVEEKLDEKSDDEDENNKYFDSND